MPLYMLLVVLEFKKVLNNHLGSIKYNRDGIIFVYSSSSLNSSSGIGPSYYYTFFSTTIFLLVIADCDFNFNTSNGISIIYIFKRGSLLTIFYFRVLICFGIDCTIGIGRPSCLRSDYSIYNIVIYSLAVIRLMCEYKLNCI